MIKRNGNVPFWFLGRSSGFFGNKPGRNNFKATQRKSMKGIPHSFKLLGTLVFLGTLAALIAAREYTSLLQEKPVLVNISKAVLLLGLMLVIVAPEKTEEEWMLRCRYKAAAATFIFEMQYFIVSHLFSLFEETISAFHVLLTGSLFYLLLFHILKKERPEKREADGGATLGRTRGGEPANP